VEFNVHEQAGDDEGGDVGFNFHDAGESDGAAAIEFNFHGAGESLNDQDGAAVVAAEAPREVADDPDLADVWVDLSWSTFIAGMMHIIQNLTRGLKDSLTYFETWLRFLTHICRLLARRHSRARFFETCLPEDRRQFLQELFDVCKTGYDVYEGRWGSIIKAVWMAMCVELPLRKFWSKDKYMHHGAEEGEREDAKSLKVSVADEGIQLELFWVYGRMIDALGEVLEVLGAWAESCPCHSEEPDVRGGGRHNSKTYVRRELGVSTCPLNCCRAFAMAAGQPMKIVERLLNKSIAILMVWSGFGKLLEEHQRLVLDDFAAARAYIVMTLMVKLGHWGVLPWHIFGIADPDEDLARQAMQMCLALFATTPHAQHWWLVVMVCSPGTIGNQQALEFIQGRSRLELPFLLSVMTRLFFASVSERWVEGRHAISAKIFHKAPHAGPVYMWFETIQKSLRDRLTERPEMFEALARCCSSVRNPMQCIQACGLRQHPGVTDLVARLPPRLLIKQGSPELIRILFHVDNRSLHAALPPLTADDMKPPPGRAQPSNLMAQMAAPPEAVDGAGPVAAPTPPDGTGEIAEPVLPPPLPPPSDPAEEVVFAIGYHHDKLWCAAAFDHLLALCARRRAQGLAPFVFSLGPHLEASPAAFNTSLALLTSPPPSAIGDDGALAIEFNYHDLALEDDAVPAVSEPRARERAVAKLAAGNIRFFFQNHAHRSRKSQAASGCSEGSSRSHVYTPHGAVRVYR